MLRRILGPSTTILGLLLLSPAIFVGVWLAQQGVIGFDPVTRDVGIVITILGLIFVAAGVTLTIRSRRGVAWKETRHVLVNDGVEERRIVIIRRSDGLCRYEQERFFHPASEDEGMEFGWQRSGGSGLFQTANDAERDARQTVPWVRDQVECPWEAIHGFTSPGEFRRFTEWLAVQVNDGAARFVERPEDERPVSSMWTRYVQHIGSEVVWRLDEPDGPFHGSFSRVDRNRPA